MAQEKILGNQLNIPDVATEVAAEPSAVASLEGSIDHANIVNGGGTNSHTQIDTHISDATVHFTEASIDHTAISNIGTNTHAQIDTHISATTLHFTTIDGLSDVVIGGIALVAGHVLSYNGANWVNAVASGGSQTPWTSDIDAAGFTVGDTDDDTKISFGVADNDTFEIFSGPGTTGTEFVTTNPIFQSIFSSFKGGSDHAIIIKGHDGGAGTVSGGGDILIAGGAAYLNHSGAAIGGGIVVESGAGTNVTGSSIELKGTSDAGTTSGVVIQGGGPTGGHDAHGASVNINAGAGDDTGNGGDVFIQPARAIATGANGAAYIQSSLMSVPPELRFRRDGNGNYVGIAARNVTVANTQVWRLPDDGESGDDNLGIDLGEFTVVNLPTAANYKNCWAMATDGGSPDTRTVVRSDGTNWKIIATEGATISA